MNNKIMTLGFVSALYLFSNVQVSYAGNPGNSKWLNISGTTRSFPTTGPVSGSPAAAPGGSPIYVTSEDGFLYAIDPATGLAATGWTPPNLHNGPSIYGGSASQGGEFISSPAVACDGTIYVASSDSHLYSINPSGGINWAAPIAQLDQSMVAAAAIGTNGTVYVTYDDIPYIYAVNNLGTPSPTVRSLDLRTVFNNPAVGIDSPPTVGPDGTIYLYADSFEHDEYLVALQDNGNSVTVKWLVNLGFFVENVNGGEVGDFQSSLIVDNSGKIYAPYSLGNGSPTSLQAFKTSDGAPVWSLPFSTPSGAPIQTSPALAANGTIYVGASDGVLYAINSNGTLKWQYDTQTHAPIRSSPAVASDGTIVFGAATGLWAVKDNGTPPTLPSWTFPLSREVDSSPLIMGPDNAIYFGCADDNVYAVYGSAPLTASDWPLYAGNIQRMAHQGPPSTICCPDTLSVEINYPPTIYKDTYSPTATSFTIFRRYPGPALNFGFYLGGGGSAQPSDNRLFAQYPQDFTPSNVTWAHAPNCFSTTIPSGQTSVTIGITAVNGNHISNSQSLMLTLFDQTCITIDPSAYQAVETIDDPNAPPPPGD
jgi:outer membrane protein assembly factor BamB